MGEYRYRENVKRGMAFVLAIILGGMAFLPGFPVFPVKAAPASGQQTTLTTAHGDTLLGHKLYCIDKGGYAIWGIAEKGDLYEAHRPSQASVPLSSQEQKYVFWAMLSLRAALGDEKANTFIRAIMVAAKAQGKPEIIKMVSEEDLKTILYVPAVRAKYPWLEAAASNSEAYMQMGGMLSGGGSGKEKYRCRRRKDSRCDSFQHLAGNGKTGRCGDSDAVVCAGWLGLGFYPFCTA